MSIDKVSQSFRILFKINNEYHSYSTRSVHHLHIPTVKSDLSKTGVKYREEGGGGIITESDINHDVSEAVLKKA